MDTRKADITPEVCVPAVRQVTCPRCRYDSPMAIYPELLLPRDEELLEQLISGELFEWKCEVCGHEMAYPFCTLINFPQHRALLLFDPNAAGDEVQDDTEPAPLPGWRVRLVRGLDALREKIALLEAGLDDVAVERMKLFMHKEGVNGIAPGDEVRFAGVDMDQEQMHSSGWLRGALVFSHRPAGDAPEKSLPFPMEMYYDYVLAVARDPRFRLPEGVPVAVDQRWMDRIMRRLT